ncbi:MAG: urease accessory protein [Betaproteobacteria bacterium]|jgi:urease accessory protein|nr:urease accessory protein [Betaproteobacteria bacterium]
MSLARLLQLASPTLPVGAYSYSQGLEAAIDAGAVKDSLTAQGWIADALEFSMARLEAPILRRLIDEPSQELNDFFLASRETAELRAETLQMGHSLAKLLGEVGIAVPIEAPAFPTAYAFAVRHWRIAPRDAVVAYLWSWLENQVMAALKAVPFGQTAGQKILLSLGERLEAIADRPLEEDRWSNFAPGLAFLSAKHETQYSRLFRS